MVGGGAGDAHRALRGRLAVCPGMPQSKSADIKIEDNFVVLHEHSFKFLLEVGQVSLPVKLRHSLGCLRCGQCGSSA